MLSFFFLGHLIESVSWKDRKQLNKKSYHEMFISISWHISYLLLPHTNQSKWTLASKNKMDIYDANKSESRQIFINLNYPDNQTRKKLFYIFCFRLRFFFGVRINFIDYFLHCHVLNEKFFWLQINFHRSILYYNTLCLVNWHMSRFQWSNCHQAIGAIIKDCFGVVLQQ